MCDVGELTGLFHDAPDMDGFLQKITSMVTEHMDCDVCSIYLYYADQNELVLRATKGLHPSSIGTVRMNLGEGLTGLSLKERRAINEGNARSNPNFRYFPGIGEEAFESFLAVPILRGTVEVGVMVIQSQKKNYFTPDDVQVFRAITAQLATAIETARLLLTLNETKQAKQPQPSAADLKLVKGRSGSEGVALAAAVVINEESTDVARFLQSGGTYTVDDYHRSLEETEQQLEGLQKHIETQLPDVPALIFTAQLLMLKDRGFTDAVLAHIQDGHNPPAAVVMVVQDYVRKFAAIQDSYLRDKIYDVKDVGRRLLENMTGLKDDSHNVRGHIAIARELLPSDALKLYFQEVKGIILLSGGPTSHIAILARSLNVPLVIAEEPALLSLTDGTKVLLDGVSGNVYINPADDVVKDITGREGLTQDIGRLKALIREKPATRDGIPVKLMANINLLGDLKAANEFKADGIGLYRSEFPFLVGNSLPSEEEQFVIYRRLVEGMPGKEVTFRTLDVGGDKILSYFEYTKEENPFLGLRSIRFSLKHKDVFCQQLRAILRAGHGHNVRILFPMISSVDEFLEAKGIVQECSHALFLDRVPHHERPALGAMIELPSVIEVIEELAEEADFFSIGSNDLTQYMLAVDRTNEKVADLYQSHHPAVLRALKKIITAANKFSKDVCICGDMAHDQKFLPVLLGLGLRQFSLDARYLPKIHERLAHVSLMEAQVMAEELLKQSKVVRTSQILDTL